jgi:hypothetical protein
MDMIRFHVLNIAVGRFREMKHRTKKVVMKRSPVQLRAQALLPLLYHAVVVEEMRVLNQGEPSI